LTIGTAIVSLYKKLMMIRKKSLIASALSRWFCFQTGPYSNDTIKKYAWSHEWLYPDIKIILPDGPMPFGLPGNRGKTEFNVNNIRVCSECKQVQISGIGIAFNGWRDCGEKESREHSKKALAGEVIVIHPTKISSCDASRLL
jgi:hypothetical protein